MNLECIVKQCFSEGQEPIPVEAIINLQTGEIESDGTLDFLTNIDVMNLDDEDQSVGLVSWNVSFTYDNKEYSFDLDLDMGEHYETDDYTNWIVSPSERNEFDKLKLFLLLNEEIPEKPDTKKNKI